MDEEKTHLWNKKMNELTVGDNAKMLGAVVGVTTGTIVALAVVGTVWEKSSSKFKQMKLDHEAKKKTKREEK